MAHIPTVDIRQLGDISFDRQLALAQQPNRDYNVDQWLFVPNTYTEYRYILGTRGEKPLICVGINPSTARPGALDPTLKSVGSPLGCSRCLTSFSSVFSFFVT